MQKSSRPVSRRAFLTAATTVAAGLPLSMATRRLSAAPAASAPAIPPVPDDPEWTFIQPKPARLDMWGRITDPGTPVRGAAEPGNIIGYIHQHTVVPILEVVQGVPINPNNPTYYRIAEGLIYTTNMQVIHPYRMPEEIREIETVIQDAAGEPQPGFWGEIVVPFTTSRQEPSGVPAELIDGSQMVLFYGSVHRVVEAKPDDADNLWYRVTDDRKDGDPFYVLARHMRPIPPHEFAPINPGANKRIEISIEGQRIDCYEDDRIVFSTLVSSGGEGFDTPKGDHAVVYKQPSRHMYSDPEAEAFSDPNYFDLPGVPFNMFITTLGHAIHGTFWHGDYGRPRSHGCVNVTPEAARWLFRWTEPAPPYEVMASGSSAEPGTPVRVS